MDLSRELMAKANIVPKLQLMKKDAHQVPRTTGPHRVKILDERLLNGIDPDTNQPRPIVRYIFEENGERRQYDVPCKDKKGDLHYLIQRFAEFQPGEEMILEAQKRGPKSFISVTRVTDSTAAEVEDDEPAIQVDEPTD
jgi:hypothetical protein